jgi:predicted nucleic acid-binding protein
VKPAMVLDASAFVEVLLGSAAGLQVTSHLEGHQPVAPAHFDAEVLSALGRLTRGGWLTDRQAAARVRRTLASPIRRDDLRPLLAGAWRRRHNLRLVDALYAELSHQLDDAPLITLDRGLAAAVPAAELVSAPAPGS